MVHIPDIDAIPDLAGKFIDAGRLQLLDTLGSGAYGRVYRALDTTSPGEKRVYYAVKCLYKPMAGSRQEEFQTREFQLHQRVCSHPNIVTFHEVFSEGRFVFVVLDLCPGGDLFAAITEKRIYRNNVELIKEAFVQLIDAVHYCHENGVFHRDIKPENVLCSQDGSHLQLADFGLSTQSRVSKDFGCGSSYYMSPECIGKELTLGRYSTRHSDIWSLGVILTNMISGRNPWRYATSKDECFAAYLHDKDFLRKVLPISDGANQLLKRIFHLNPLCRITLPELRKEVMRLDTFFMSEAELSSASPCVRAAAVDVNTNPGVSEPPLEDTVQDASGSNDSETSVSSDEVYTFDSPSDDPLPAFQHGPARVLPDDAGHFIIGSTSSISSESNSGTESSGPITPASQAVDPATDVPDLPEDQGIGQSANPAAEIAYRPAPAQDMRGKKPPARHTHLFRMAVRRIKGLSAGSGSS
ncbi:serine/threonine protein kinase, negative regulator of sexual conjugation and meiosis [Infundibulicybe gibba]|nr:serine/threonine protein kinase, negative regulator of sexual conjugation and meiosis [Infundibulicybe gibba]